MLRKCCVPRDRLRRLVEVVYTEVVSNSITAVFLVCNSNGVIDGRGPVMQPAGCSQGNQQPPRQEIGRQGDLGRG